MEIMIRTMTPASFNILRPELISAIPTRMWYSDIVCDILSWPAVEIVAQVKGFHLVFLNIIALSSQAKELMDGFAKYQVHIFPLYMWEPGKWPLGKSANLINTTVSQIWAKLPIITWPPCAPTISVRTWWYFQFLDIYSDLVLKRP